MARRGEGEEGGKRKHARGKQKRQTYGSRKISRRIIINLKLKSERGTFFGHHALIWALADTRNLHDPRDDIPATGQCCPSPRRTLAEWLSPSSLQARRSQSRVRVVEWLHEKMLAVIKNVRFFFCCEGMQSIWRTKCFHSLAVTCDSSSCCRRRRRRHACCWQKLLETKCRQ